MDHIIGGKYKLGRKIGGQCSMEVYVGTDNQSGKEFAVIMESVQTEHPQLRKEYEFYRLLQGGTGIPHFEWFGVEGECNVMVVELLGKDLYSLFRSCGRKFSLKTVLMLADQMLDQLEYMHDKGYLHRYIVPRNLLMGSGHNADQVYMVNYRYLSTRECMPFRENKGFIGDARYASANAHCEEQGKRDDLESLGYVLMTFLGKRLPWDGLKDKTPQQIRVKEKKMQTPIEVLCKSCPPEFMSYFNHCRSLGLYDRPNYSHLKGLFGDIFIREGYKRDYVFDWTNKRPILSKLLDPFCRILPPSRHHRQKMRSQQTRHWQSNPPSIQSAAALEDDELASAMEAYSIQSAAALEDDELASAMEAYSIQSAAAEGVPISNSQPTDDYPHNDLHMSTSSRHENNHFSLPYEYYIYSAMAAPSAPPATEDILAEVDKLALATEAFSIQSAAAEGVTISNSQPTAPPATEDVLASIQSAAAQGVTVSNSQPTDGPHNDLLSTSSHHEDNHIDGNVSASGSCVICMDAAAEVACIPCGHRSGCMSCLNHIKSKNQGCPVCRSNIDQVVKIYLPV